jgi:hypothetical protein
MPGPDRRRLVLVTWTARAGARGDGLIDESCFGTGYFITDSIVLTACHVIPNDVNTPISIRVEEGEPRWRENGRVQWRDETLDAALILVSPPLPADVVAVRWSEALPATDVTWHSTCYPEASLVEAEQKTAGLRGTLYASGGSGQGPRELDLGVKDPPAMEGWKGASGAPIFVGEELVGFVKSTGFGGRRFQGTPAMALRQNVGFRLQTEPEWLKYPRTDPWLLVLMSEAGSEPDLLTAVKGSFERHEESIEKALNGPLLSDNIIPVGVSEAFETPGRWLQLVQALCAAPLMIADVTEFEPGVMLALGVRAVVRRGVTVATTSNRLDDAEFDKLPFNIQETKLISHGDKEPGITDESPSYSLNIVANTFVSGIRELQTNPRYLDLPAYDAVRCPTPEVPHQGQQRVREEMLALCSFQQEYAEHWRNLFDGLAKYYPKKRTIRMRDVVSPRLVGQALYESIRWTKTCVIDWTHWRSNVFFELGVRLACSNIEPVCILEESDARSPLTQVKKLLSLLSPTLYTLPNIKTALKEALDAHEQQIKVGDGILPRRETRVPVNGTYEASLAAFNFRQERVTMPPHDLLRFSNEALLGKDRQRTGATPVLFSANPKFNEELSRSTRERWIAAWLYLRHRFADPELRSNEHLCRELKQLGETLLQEVRDDPSEPFIGKLRTQVLHLIESLDESET